MKSISILLVFLCIIFLKCKSDEIGPEDHPGHLKSFGSSGPFFDVPVVDKFPTTKEFFNQHVIPSIPLVIKGGAKLSPAYTKWTDEYFVSHPGANEIIFAGGRKKEVRTFPGYDMEFKEFVATYKDKDIYMVSSTPTFMRSDILVPPPLACDHVINLLNTEVMWFSSGGTISHLHNDDVDNINCLFRGTKTLVFVNPHDFKNVDWYNKVLDGNTSSFSNVDVESVDYVKYPQLINTRYAVVNMEEGDCLFIPYKWPHQVNSFGSSNLAANVWFNHLKEDNFDIDMGLCGSVKNITLDKILFEKEEKKAPQRTIIDFSQNYVVFDKDYEDGEIPNMPSYQETHPMFFYMLETIKHRKPEIDFDDFVSGNSDIIPRGVNTINEECLEYLKTMFRMIDVNNNNVIDINDYKQIRKGGIDNLEHYAQNLEKMIKVYHDLVVLAQFQVGKNMTKTLVSRGDISTQLASVIFGEQYLADINLNITPKEEL